MFGLFENSNKSPVGIITIDQILASSYALTWIDSHQHTHAHGHEGIRINMHFTDATRPHHIQVIHLCIDRNIQPNVTAGISIYNVNS